MFLWCPSCRRLSGEAPPLSEYSSAIELCPACAGAGAKPGPEAPARMRGLLDRLGRGLDSGPACESALGEALRAGMRPSEALLGLIQPALYDAGTRWERGLIRAADEHRLTAVALRMLELLPPPPPPREPDVLLAPVDGNQHYIGVRLLERVAQEEGCGALAVYPGLPDEEIVDLAWHRRSALVGLSVADPASLPAAARLARRLRRELPGTRVALGGSALRRGGPAPPPGVAVLPTLDAFRAELAGLRPAHAAR